MNFFDNNVKKIPNKTAFIFEGKKISWQEADQQVNKYAGFLKSQNINKGDCFAILMDNSPDFLMVFYASFRIGSIAALINTTVSGEGLKTCNKYFKCKINNCRSFSFGKTVTALEE